MAVKLEPLMWGQSTSIEKLIPFTNYSRWERKPRFGRSTNGVPSQFKTQEPWSGGRPERKCSVPKLPRTLTKAKSIHKPQEPPEICILNYHVGTKKESVESNRVYSEKLYTRNLSIMGDIVKMEEDTHSCTDQILDRYEHFKGVMAKLKLKSSESLSRAQEDLESTRVRLRDQIEVYRAKVAKMDGKIENCSRELQVLHNYKDNEFPVSLVRIEQMKDRLDEEQLSHKEDIEALKLGIAEEKELYQQHVEADKMQIKAKATKEHLKSMKKSMEAKALQNNLIRKELVLHQKARTDLTRDITELKRSIAGMKSSLGRKKIQIKCLPDSEIVLNIPLQEPLLPI